MNYLIYILFGKDQYRFKNELICSLLSFKKFREGKKPGNIKILVYTEHPVELPAGLHDLGVNFNYLHPNEIAGQIARGNGHSLILKAHVMLHFLQTYKANGILIDTDTFFVDDPERLFEVMMAGHVLMHVKEYPLSLRPRIEAFLNNNSFKKLNGSQYTIPPTLFMWNSGLVGLQPHHVKLLPEIIYLIEQISFNKDWPAEESRLIEQTAYSYFLQTQAARLLPAEKYVVHYWFSKELRHLLGGYFNVYCQEDQEEFTEFLKKRNIDDWNFGDLTYDDLLPLTFRFMNLYDLLEPYHYECLPADTSVGKLLRSS